MPAITGGVKCSDSEKRLMSLPPRFGDLGISIFSEPPQKKYEFLTILSKDLTVSIIISNDNSQPTTMLKRSKAK